MTPHWQQPRRTADGAEYTEDGEHWVLVLPDGRMIVGDGNGSTRLPAGSAQVVAKCFASTRKHPTG